MTEEAKALVPVQQRDVEFYGDQIAAVQLDDGSIYVPIRPICGFLGIDWSAQRQRILRDAVLASEIKGVVVTTTPGGPQEMTCLPLPFIPGWLFGINANRVKEELREKIITYQRECFQVLWEAFETGRLTQSELMTGDSPAVRAYQLAMAVADLARHQVLMEARLSGRMDNVEQRLESIEATLGDPGRHITEEQASQLSQAVKAVAMKMSESTGRNEYGGVYGELYRKFGITSYKHLPAAKFDEALGWLTAWHQSLVGEEPF